MPETGLRLIDLFSGAGGMTLGFSKNFGHAFDTVQANDFDDGYVPTYRMNFGDHCVSGDIADILNDRATEIPATDIVIGGPPWQGFTLLNKAAKAIRESSFGVLFLML